MDVVLRWTKQRFIVVRPNLPWRRKIEEEVESQRIGLQGVFSHERVLPTQRTPTLPNSMYLFNFPDMVSRHYG